VRPISFKRHWFPPEVIRYAVSTQAAVYNCFNTQPHLIHRPTVRRVRAAAHQVWAAVPTAA
jgi:hypothetical protein